MTDITKMVREIRHALYTIIRQASRDGNTKLVADFRALRNSFHIFQYPIVFKERLAAIIMEVNPDIKSALEDIFNRGKADTLEEFIFDVKIYLSENGTTLQDWHRCVDSMKYISEDLAQDISHLMTIIFDQEDEEQDIEVNIGYMASAEAFNNGYQLIAPTREEQEQKLIKIGVQLCPSCKSPQENAEICDYCINYEN